jgi:hypothetical protein
MKKNDHYRKLSAFVLGLLVFFSAGLSQVTAQEDDDDVFDLSPFTITSEEDSGYAATSTLAGTRLKSNLKDPDSVSNLTKKNWRRSLLANTFIYEKPSWSVIRFYASLVPAFSGRSASKHFLIILYEFTEIAGHTSRPSNSF